ncbi:MAG: hypothetical protein H0V79_09850 [Actinobacteria bacterium]|nr:hypothetical protein [Actinomycetota bacterium]
MTCAIALLLTFIPFGSLAVAFFLPERTIRRFGGRQPERRTIGLLVTGFAGLGFALYFDCFA